MACLLPSSDPQREHEHKRGFYFSPKVMTEHSEPPGPQQDLALFIIEEIHKNTWMHMHTQISTTE
jgi:hypothetical protein